jgi:hypothetical protein
MLFNLSEKHEYMYKYMIGFLFLNFAIYSDIHYCISNKILHYFKYLRFICLLVIIYICSLDISSGILLAIAFVLFDNIINVKKYLRELFINYFESFTNSFKLTNKEIKEVKDHCEEEKWNGDTCSQLKKNITDICMQNDPWKTITMGEGEEKVELNCPEIKKTF